MAGASGSEDGVASILLAACSSKTLQLLDVRGLPLRMQVSNGAALLLTVSSVIPLQSAKGHDSCTGWAATFTIIECPVACSSVFGCVNRLLMQCVGYWPALHH